MKIFIANNANALEALNLDATVECEFGSSVVQGSILTLAHHGPRANRPCPCAVPNLPKLGIKTVGISHVDLDTLGGLLAIRGSKPGTFNWVHKFWEIAEFVDLNGVHKLTKESWGGAPDFVKDSLNAWWAWSESEGRVFPPRDGSAQEIDLSKHFEVITDLLVCDTNGDWASTRRSILIEKGKIWAAAKEELKNSSWVAEDHSVVLRKASSFTNHLYNLKDGNPAKAVVAYRPDNRSVTISLADPIDGVSCVEIAQSLWGPDAGGHLRIAGSPRSGLPEEESIRAFEALVEKLKEVGI